MERFRRGLKLSKVVKRKWPSAKQNRFTESIEYAGTITSNHDERGDKRETSSRRDSSC
jgi:hypothetical protein